MVNNTFPEGGGDAASLLKSFQTAAKEKPPGSHGDRQLEIIREEGVVIQSSLSRRQVGGRSRFDIVSETVRYPEAAVALRERLRPL